MAISGGLAFLGGVAQGINKQYDEYYKESADMRKLQAALDVERYKTKKKVYDDNKEAWDILQPVVNGEVTGEPAFRLVQGAIDPEGKRTEVLRQMFNNNTLHHYLKSFEPGDEPTYESRNDLTEPYRITNHPLAKLRANIFGEPTTTTDARAILFRQQAKKLEELNPEGKQIQGKLDIKAIERGGILVGVDAEGNAKELGRGQPIPPTTREGRVSDLAVKMHERDAIGADIARYGYTRDQVSIKLKSLQEELVTAGEAEKENIGKQIAEAEEQIQGLNSVIAQKTEKYNLYTNDMAAKGQTFTREQTDLGGVITSRVGEGGAGGPAVVSTAPEPQSELARFNQNADEAIKGALEKFQIKLVAQGPDKGGIKPPKEGSEWSLPGSVRFGVYSVYKDKLMRREITFAEIESDLTNNWRLFTDDGGYFGRAKPPVLVPKFLTDDQARIEIETLRRKYPNITDDEIIKRFSNPAYLEGLRIRSNLGVK